MATPTLNPKITAAGLALFPNGDLNGFQVELTHIAIGTGQYVPVLNADGRATQTALVAEVARYKITSGTNPTPTSVQIGTTITDTDDTGRSPNGKFISEIGFYAGNTLFAVWSRVGEPLFYKSASFPVPFAYTMDVTVLPDNAVTIVLNTDTTGMAALILAHEAKVDPHTQYYMKAGGVIGKQDTGWAGVLAPTSRVADTGSGATGGLAIESYQPMIYVIDRTAGHKSSRARYDNGNWNFDYDSAGNYTFGAVAARIALDGAQTSFVPGIFVAGRQSDDGTGAKIQAAGSISASVSLIVGATLGSKGYVQSDAVAAYFYGEKAANYGTLAAQPVNFVTSGLTRASITATGELLVGGSVLDGTGAKLQVNGYASFDTPPVGDSSRRGATTEFVSRLVRTNEIGAIRIEVRTSVRAGYLKLNGALVNRADYPELWAYAQAGGALVTEAQWTAGSWGCFSIGDGQLTFRLPEWRGEGLRFLDDGRGVDVNRAIGTYQADQNKTHAHTATAAENGSHAHGAWTDAQGYHYHGSATTTVGDHQHMSGISRSVQIYGGGGPADDIGENLTANPVYTGWGGAHAHGIYGDGSHAHNIGMNAAGAHTHALTVAADGGAEVRVRTISALAMIRAF